MMIIEQRTADVIKPKELGTVPKIGGKEQREIAKKGKYGVQKTRLNSVLLRFAFPYNYVVLHGRMDKQNTAAFFRAETVVSRGRAGHQWVHIKEIRWSMLGVVHQSRLPRRRPTHARVLFRSFAQTIGRPNDKEQSCEG